VRRDVIRGVCVRSFFPSGLFLPNRHDRSTHGRCAQQSMTIHNMLFLDYGPFIPDTHHLPYPSPLPLAYFILNRIRNHESKTLNPPTDLPLLSITLTHKNPQATVPPVPRALLSFRSPTIQNPESISLWKSFSFCFAWSHTLDLDLLQTYLHTSLQFQCTISISIYVFTALGLLS
jgi:hypothetical protein